MIKVAQIFFILCITLSGISEASFSEKGENINYRTHFGQCPSRVVGKLALELVKIFEQKGTLKAVKEKIIKDDLKEKYYLSSYDIHYNPLSKLLRFSFQCPRPLMKAQIYKGNGTESYYAILVDNGRLFDPNYELLLRSEAILKESLPSLALPLGEIDQGVQVNIAKLLNQMDKGLKNNISEVIINEESDLTIIFSVKNRPSSAFLGKDQWGKKLAKLQRIINYMSSKRKIPSIINLTDSKKIVVKFSEKL